MVQSVSSPSESGLLFVAHPGHELRVHGWLEQARPIVLVLTDGSGHTGLSRLHSTLALLARAGVEGGSILGRLTDAQAYSAILKLQFTTFIELTDELAETLVARRVELVAGDACEGYNPVHDACRLMIDAAVALARCREDRVIASYDFPLVGRPDACPERARPEAIWLALSPKAFSRKLDAARDYPELAGEVAAAVDGIDPDVFRVECLRPVTTGAGEARPDEDPPYYELYGQKQVDAGHYKDVIRFREHLLPLADELRRHVAQEQRSHLCAC